MNFVQQTKTSLTHDDKTYIFYSLPELGNTLEVDLSRLPYSIRILLECCLRNQENTSFSPEAVLALARWQSKEDHERDAVSFLPARILMQDFTGLPVLNDLTALRAALVRQGIPPETVQPAIPVDVVIDHSVQVQEHGCADARRLNEELEVRQNLERYRFLKWSQNAYENLRILPPGLGICHQVNLEHLAKVAVVRRINSETVIFPDSVLGTDSHTTMVNGLGVAGWGVGGIEALAAMLGYPSEFPIPDVIGLELTGTLSDRVTPTDLTLAITSRLREVGVVGRFVELCGEGYERLPVETRAMIANMSPESGATMTYCPVDAQTLAYLHRTGRDETAIALTERFFRSQGLFQEPGALQPDYSQIIPFDLAQVVPLVAGPRRPQDVIPLHEAGNAFHRSLSHPVDQQGFGLDDSSLTVHVHAELNGEKVALPQGTVLIAAITSCTNTSHPEVIVAAALLAQRAAARGLHPKPWVKTSFAPGSRAVSAYLEKSGLMGGLEALGFHVVGYGCTTCIGNSGPLDDAISRAVREGNLVAAAVLSGNRNFEGRIHPDARANYLASPPMVIAYALAGSMDVDFEADPLGQDAEGKPVFLREIYPTGSEIQRVMDQVVKRDLYIQTYQGLYERSPHWNALDAPASAVFPWDERSTLLREPFFLLMNTDETDAQRDILGARVLAYLGDSITTDHISPAGRIAPKSPAGTWLEAQGVAPGDFISYGARRGHDGVMLRGTLANPRLCNRLAEDREGGFTRLLPDGPVLPIYEAAMQYRQKNTPLLILAGKDYGTGSSRDWAAKGVYLLGVRAVLAASFERIHRTNLVCMGVLPLQFLPGQDAISLGLTGEEEFTITGIGELHTLKALVHVAAQDPSGEITRFKVTARIDTPLEMVYYRAGGLMHRVLADLTA
jgi:aconitate hydratase